MRRALLLAGAIMLLAGCVPDAPEPNKPPAAFVPAISLEFTQGDTVRLSGYGEDEDGAVVGYLWRSDLDGELSRLATFETNSLSVGEHVISFSVQDNNGAWSEPVRHSITVHPVVAPPPVVKSFTTSSPTVRKGESVTLSWNVAGAATVSIDQGIGVVPLIGAEEVRPEVTTSYRLTAESDGVSVSAMVTVTVDPVEVVVLSPSLDLSGYVRFSGYAFYSEVYVGDDEADRGVRGFLTYHLSTIPEGAVISRVIIDMSGHDAPYDDPFGGLGCLSVFEHPYNTLQGQYRMPGVPGALQQWCDPETLDTPITSVGIRDALQARLGEDRFQLRLQFAERETDIDQTRDFLRWSSSRLPTLTVEYLVERQ